MNTIYKYKITVDDYQTISMPIGTKVLSVQVQHGIPQIRALCNQNNLYEERKFRLSGTGHTIHENNLNFIGTFQLNNGGLVFHLFEILENK